MNYAELASALLERGDTPRSVIAFLRTDYGLDTDQADAALILARTLPEEPRRRTPPPHRRPRAVRTRSKL